MEIKKRLYLLIAAIAIVFLVGSIGYYLLFQGTYRYIDCIYMTVISLTSVGYGEVIEITGNVPAQIFTMILITFGMSIILYGLSSMTALLIEGELTGILRKNKMNKMVQKLKGHYIVCGGDETGRHLLLELVASRKQVVLIEADPTRIESTQSQVSDLLYIQGDPTDDEHLIAAGIERAAGILAAMPSDKDNLYIAMSARMLSKPIRIVSRLADPRLEAKLVKAGADRVVSPNAIGALRMASEMIRPAVVNFLDTMLRSDQGDLRISELQVSAGSALENRDITATGLKDTYSLLVLGTRDSSGAVTFNPPPETILRQGMTLIVMGKTDDIAAVSEG